MARCPSCEQPLPVRAASCANCNATFGGEAAWQPLPDTALEKLELQLRYPGRKAPHARPASSPQNVRWLRFAVTLACAVGALLHVGMLAAATRGPLGPVGLAIALGWSALPYIAVMGGQLSLRTSAGLLASLVTTIGLIALDFGAFASANGHHDWLALFMPPVLLVGAAIAYLLAFLVDRAS
jgi:hypothetical protein